MEIETKPNDVERGLIEKYAALKDLSGQLKIQIANANAEMEKVEAELMQLLDDQGKKSSAKYEGLGHVTCKNPTAWARIIKGQEDNLFNGLREIGRDDLLKLTVHSRTLTTFIRERLENHQPVPEGCEVYYERGLSFYPFKG